MSVIITYTDGTTQSCQPTLFDTIQAEKYATSQGWGSGGTSVIATSSYATYATLRRRGLIQTGQTFEQWAQTVARMDTSQAAGDEVGTPSDAGSGDLPAPLPDGPTGPSTI
ncbi:MAG: hypothetical protein [Bacteriophage sp.]|nr:MAG: hypothetical protein [Bacteriophage sp.]